MIDLSDLIADPAIFGWKAHFLSVLMSEGFAVPRAIALAATEKLGALPFDEGMPLAVRSSGVGEDSALESHAGHFETVLGVRGHPSVQDAVDRVRASAAGEMPMGVVIQEMVESPIASGVAFSCHPLTFNPDVALISWVSGLGDGLVDGSRDASEVEVSRTDGAIISGVWPHSPLTLVELVRAVKVLDEWLGAPVDVEWSIRRDSELLLLQVRPVVLGPSLCQDLDSLEAFDVLPGPVKAHSKISLRRDATRLGIPMSRARAFVGTRGGADIKIEPMIASDDASGRSVVLLHPHHIEGHVVRQFSKDCSTDVDFVIRGCQRYTIRQYPAKSNATAVVRRTLAIGLEASPLACVIEQELLYAYATGILRRTDQGYLVELAIGHFVPKGYVETSTFYLDDELRVVLRSVAPQAKAYHFVNGHVVVESPPFEQLEIDDGDLARIARVLRPLVVERPSAAVEFGLLGRPGDFSPYMIDIADSDAGAASLSSAEIRRGIISMGLAQGRVVDLRGSTTIEDLNAHLLDEDSSAAILEREPVLYIARQASADLLALVRACHRSSGFIFERASLLAHLAVVLRERGIPAVTLESVDIDSIVRTSGSWCLDTSAHRLLSPQEVR